MRSAMKSVSSAALAVMVLAGCSTSGRAVQDLKSGRAESPLTHYIPSAFSGSPPATASMSLADAQQQVGFALRAPRDPLGQGIRAYEHFPRGAVIRNKDLSIAEWHSSSEASASSEMWSAVPNGEFDPRYMERVTIAGAEAIAWDKVDVMDASSGVRVPFSGIVFRVGQDWYAINSPTAVPRGQLVRVAQSMLP